MGCSDLLFLTRLTGRVNRVAGRRAGRWRERRSGRTERLLHAADLPVDRAGPSASHRCARAVPGDPLLGPDAGAGRDIADHGRSCVVLPRVPACVCERHRDHRRGQVTGLGIAGSSGYHWWHWADGSRANERQTARDRTAGSGDLVFVSGYEFLAVLREATATGRAARSVRARSALRIGMSAWRLGIEISCILTTKAYSCDQDTARGGPDGTAGRHQEHDIAHR